MTNFSEMTDQELDRWIEVKRNGYQKHLEPQYTEWVTEDGKDGGSGFSCPRCGIDDYECVNNPYCTLKYTTDPKYAMELLKEMKDTPSDMLALEYVKSVLKWKIELLRITFGLRQILVFSDTPERAIAEAWAVVNE